MRKTPTAPTSLYLTLIDEERERDGRREGGGDGGRVERDSASERMRERAREIDVLPVLLIRLTFL